MMQEDETTLPPEESSTLVELLSSRAALQGERTAYTYLIDGEAEEARLTYGELDRRARVIGARLQQAGAAGSRVLLLYQPGLDYIAAFFGCLYAGAVAVPAYPPRINRNLARLQAIVADSRATVALTDASGLAKIESLRAKFPELGALHWEATDALHDELAAGWCDPEVGGDSLAFLQYTSGSTAAPKGVMVCHRHILHNERVIREGFGQSSQSVIVGWLPLYHDMGLIGNVLQALYSGAHAILMSPAAFLQSPFRWLQAVSRYRATTSGGPNFAYDICVRGVKPEQLKALDLSSWSVAFNGAEPIRAATLERFAETFTPCGFRKEAFAPCYGLAEATLMVSCGAFSGGRSVSWFEAEALKENRARAAAPNARDARPLVSSGRVAAAQRVVIADVESAKPCAAGEVGEVWVEGPSVTAGYWDRPEETAETFKARLAGEGAGAFLRTGDLGFIRDGELFITGRLKDLIIVRGRNHYPHDLELTAERSHAALRPGGGAAFSVEAGGAEQIVLVHELEPGRHVNLESVLDAIFQAVAEEHEVSIYAVVLVKAGRVPKTSSGKIRRAACREQFIKGELEPVAERRADAHAPDESSEDEAAEPVRTVAELERWLAARLSAKLNVDAAKIETRQPLARYGLDSLAALELTQAVETRFGLSLPVTTFLQSTSLGELAEELHAEIETRLATTEAHAATTGAHDAAANQPGSASNEPDADAGETKRYPLSHGQQALWYLHQLAPDGAAYNIAAAVRILDAPDVPALRRAFQRLLERHASLRATFKATPGGPVQEILPRQELCFQHVNTAEWDEALLGEHLVEESRRAFDLERGPMLRVSLYGRAPLEHVLLLVVHHIVADFWSLAILTHELGLLYRSEVEGRETRLAPQASLYADHVRQQAETLAGPEGRRMLTYWRNRLAGELPLLDLPLDRPRPPLQTFDGAAETFRLNAELTAALKSLSRAQGVTVYMTLLAAFQVLLHRYANQREVIVGSPASGRTRPESAGVVGYFVNPVALRASFEARQSFADFLRHVRRTVFEALEHQDYPFALLVERLQPVRDAARSPVFQAMFVLQKESLFGDAGGVKELGGLRVEPYTLEQTFAQFDLTLKLTEVGCELSAAFEYNADLFGPQTVRRMAGCFRTLLRAITEDPAADIARLPLLNADERRLLAGWNDTAVTYDEGRRSLHQLFEEQAARTPDAAALRFGEEQLSYAALDERANRLARHLRGLGVGPEVLVGVLMERSVEMVVSLLAILKAGGAYVPLDPDSPPERLSLMTEEAAPGALLTQVRWLARLPQTHAPVVCVDEWLPENASAGGEGLEGGVMPEHLAYVIYTSGSTGRPKGVMVSHAAIVNRLLWMQRQYGLGPADRVLQKTSFTFDVSVWEFFWPLVTGACLVLARPGGQQDSAYLAELIQRERVTVMHFVPSMLRVFLEEEGAGECASLREVICSGEALTVELQERFYERMKARLHNLYGPTEAAVDVTFCECVRGRAVVPIGRPIANTQIHVLNEELEPTPIGVAGELYIAGAGLARGYVRRADLTAERFVPNPFGARGGERRYRTGDLARYLPDGQIEFLGRLDYQVKVRGFRIELGEIEAALKRHPQVTQAVVLAKPGGDGSPRLVAYVVAHEPAPAEWRRHLALSLPEYMIPSTFVALPELPLTSSAKVDRRALLAMDAGEQPGSDRPYVAPRTEAERLVADIWAEVLGVGRVGVHDNFFELGGHSLLATQFVSRVHERFQVNVPLSALFNRALTVEGMTQAIEEYQIKQAREQDVDELMQMLDGLSDEEVKALLAGK